MELHFLGLPKSIAYFTFRTIKFKVATVSVKLSLEVPATETLPIKSLPTPSLENGLPILLANNQTSNLKNLYWYHEEIAWLSKQSTFSRTTFESFIA